MWRETQVIATQAAYIDPAGCGSIVAYNISKRRKRLSASVDICDCNRKIEWYFNNSADSIKKIDKAIEILSNFRRDFIAAQKNSRKPRRKSGK